VQIVHFGHAGVLIDTGSARLLIDPGTFSTGIEDLQDLDAILITHQHIDHLDVQRLPAIVQANPRAMLIIDPGSAADVAKAGLTAQVMRPGEAVEFAGTAVHAVGGDHAMIHSEVPRVPNNGYVVGNGAFYHPGDALFVPDEGIDVLAVPIGAPWLKLAEAVEFERAVAPRVAVPIHEALLSDIGQQLTCQWLSELAPVGTEFRRLTPREPADL
jgi:L-ascorbate metabolism protein UlaG (beta-lactamase superfamily)